MTLKAVAANSGALSPSQQAILGLRPATQLPKFRAALGKTKTGQSNTRVLCIGDSITMGAYSNGSGSGDWRNNSWPNQLAKMFRNSGVPAYSNSFMGFTCSANDGRLVKGSSWDTSVVTAGSTTVGGSFASATTNTNALTFAPSDPVDTFKVWYPKLLSSGTFSYSINGATATNVNTNGASAFTSLTATTALSSSLISFSWVSGGFTDIGGVEAWNSAEACINFVNAGWNGSTTTQWNDNANPWSPLGNIALMGQDLTIIMLSTNDMLQTNGPISVATMRSNLQNIITQALIAGDVIICCPVPLVVDANTQSAAAQAQYIAAIMSLANSNNIPVVDLFDRWVSYAVSNPLGYYMGGGFAADLHPVALGYSDISQAIYNVIGNV